MIRRTEIDNQIEESIITGLIISDKFCRDIQQALKPEYFQVPYARRISKWVIDYYNQYKKAPIGHIEDIFRDEKLKLKEEEADLISSFLSKLSDKFEQEKNFNAGYLYDEAILYFKKRSLKLTSEIISQLVDMNKLDEATAEITKYKDVSKNISGWTDPFDESVVKKFFKDRLDHSNELFKLPGQLGELLGNFERNWLFGILAPMKRGKSFFLQEIALQGIIEGYKVAFFSLEMDLFRLIKRLYTRITATTEQKGAFIYPCFDCKKNQLNMCNKSIRSCNTRLLDQAEHKPQFGEHDKSYVPCIACRGSKDYVIETWFTTYTRDNMKVRNVLSTVKGIKKMYGDNIRLFSYPAYSANLSVIKNDLQELEFNQDFIPDVICIDYADILAPEDSRTVGRERLDDTWKTLKNMSDSRHCLVVTASQSNRASLDKIFVTQKDIAEDIRKVAHVDAMISLNQSPEEKKAGVIRITEIAKRDDDFDQFKSCTVLQNLKLGQTLLDSEIGNIRKEKETK